jgi:leucyl-tRNA synthetase
LVLTVLKNDVQKYIEASKRKSDLDRTDLAKTKTGTPTGAFAINHANRKKIEIWSLITFL